MKLLGSPRIFSFAKLGILSRPAWPPLTFWFKEVAHPEVLFASWQVGRLREMFDCIPAWLLPHYQPFHHLICAFLCGLNFLVKSIKVNIWYAFIFWKVNQEIFHTGGRFLRRRRLHFRVTRSSTISGASLLIYALFCPAPPRGFSPLPRPAPQNFVLAPPRPAEIWAAPTIPACLIQTLTYQQFFSEAGYIVV